MKRLTALLACLFLSACSLWHGESSESPPAPAAHKTIGVISALSENATLADIGNLGWEKGSMSFPIDDWHLNDEATDQVSGLLRRAGYDVRPVHYAVANFQASAIDGPVTRGGLLDRKRPNLAPIIRRSVQPNDLDYYLVLVEAGGESGAYQLRGVGLLHQRSEIAAFVLYHAFLIDGHSGKVVDDSHADPLGNGWYNAAKIDGPFTDLRKDAWPNPIADWSTEQRQKLHETVLQLLQESLPKTLQQVLP